MSPRNRRRAGVTLIEMMVVVTIIALFAALVLPRMIGQTDKARRAAANLVTSKTNMNEVVSRIVGGGDQSVAAAHEARG